MPKRNSPGTNCRACQLRKVKCVRTSEHGPCDACVRRKSTCNRGKRLSTAIQKKRRLERKGKTLLSDKNRENIQCLRDAACSRPNRHAGHCKLRRTIRPFHLLPSPGPIPYKGAVKERFDAWRDSNAFVFWPYEELKKYYERSYPKQKDLPEFVKHVHDCHELNMATRARYTWRRAGS